MKKILLNAMFLFAVLAANASGITAHNDSTQTTLKTRLEFMEKQVKQLHAEIKVLKSADSSLTTELTSIRQSGPLSKPKKMVIDRRGSKQAYFQ